MTVLRYVLIAAFVGVTSAGFFGGVYDIPGVGSWIPLASAVGVIGVWVWGRAVKPPRFYAGYEHEYRKLKKSKDLVPMIIRTTNQAGGGGGWTRWSVSLMPSSSLALRPGKQIRSRAVIDTPDDEPPLNGETWLCAVSEKYPELVVPIRRDPLQAIETLKQPNSQVVELASNPHASVTKAVRLLGTAAIIGVLATGLFTAATGEVIHFGAGNTTAAQKEPEALTPDSISSKVRTLIDKSGTSTFGQLNVSLYSVTGEVLAAPGSRQIDVLSVGYRDEFTREGLRTLSKDELWREADFSKLNPQDFAAALERGLQQANLTDSKVTSVEFLPSKSNSESIIAGFAAQTDYGTGTVRIRNDGTLLSAYQPDGEEAIFATLLAPGLRELAWSNMANALAGKEVATLTLRATDFFAVLPDDTEITCDDIGCNNGFKGNGSVSAEISDGFTLSKLPWDKYTLQELTYTNIYISEGTVLVRVEVPEADTRIDRYDFDGKLIES